MTEEFAEKYVKGEFEIEGVQGLNATISALVREKGEAPSHILDIHDRWYVDVKWTLKGKLARMLCGTFQVDAYLESIGHGKELELPDDSVTLSQVQIQPYSTGEYSARFDVPPEFIQASWEKEPDGSFKREPAIPYKMVVTVTYKDPVGRPGPLAGFVEYPMLTFYYDLD